MTDVKFPTYKREEQKNVKLTTEQVAELRAEFKTGETNKSALARKYNISNPTVDYWLLTDEERAEKNRNKKKQPHNPEVQRRYLERKRQYDPEGVRAYRNAHKNKSKGE